MVATNRGTTWSRDKGRRSWQRLSFKRKQTTTGLLAEERTRARRAMRLTFAVAFTVLATVIIGVGQEAITGGVAWLGLGSFVLTVNFVVLLLVRAYHPELPGALPSYLIFVTVFLGAARGLLESDISPFLIPVPLLAMMIAITYAGPLAVQTSVAVSVLVAAMVSLSGGFGNESRTFAFFHLSEAVVLCQVVGSVVAVLGARRLRSRTRLVIVGTAAGLGMWVAAVVFELCSRPFPTEAADWGFMLDAPLYAFVNGVLAGMIMTSALPFLERWLDLTTDMRLLELADQNSPLLREMSLLAPGSFQHSLMVGQLAEEAAQSIGANDLLARVGALYHDIGKMLKPNYFVENIQGDENIHDRLSPEMSRLIIISHVKDGIRIAEEEGLPDPIVEMIPMHHGTSVVEYFYHKKRKQEVDQNLGETGNEAFQYPGPKPTFKEAGILMLADATEAISRSLQDPTPTRLRAVVRDVINKKMADGQLDDCELTMRDLHAIEDAFVRVLVSIHHGRIKYPSQEETLDLKSGRGESKSSKTESKTRADTKGGESKRGGDPKGSESKRSNSKGSETKGSETKSSETKSSETKSQVEGTPPAGESSKSSTKVGDRT